MANTSTWDNIKSGLAEGLGQVFPVIGKDRELHLEDVEIKDNRDAGDYAAQKQAILNKSNWNVPVYGTLVLKDKGGKVLEKRKTRLLSIPKLTNRNTIIYNGTEYSIANQLRLRPGVYTTTGDDGVTRSQFNVGKGANFDVWQDPANGIFYMQFDQSSVPLYPVLKDIGVSDEEIAARWGKEILDSNKQVTTVKYKNAVVKAYKKMTYSEDDVSYDDAKAKLKDVLSKAILDPLVTKATLKKEHSNITPDVLLGASRKVLKINRAEEQPDDRESLVYKAVHGPDDFIRESITKGSRPVLGKVKSRLNSMYGEGIKQIFAPGTLSLPIYTNINASPLVSVAQDANPLGLMEAANRITSFGPGGITNTYAIPEAVRNIHPSQIGFIDPVRTPESDKAGIDLQLSIGAKKDKNTLTIKLKDRNGEDVRKPLTELQGKVVALPGQQGKLKVEAIKDGKLVTVSKTDVDYSMSGPNRMFSNSTVLVPFLSNNAGARANLAGKMGVQALSLKYREKPLVQTAADIEGRTNEDVIGEKITQRSPVSGEVTKVTDKAVEITDKSGKKHVVNLYQNYIIGSKNFLHNEPSVAKGDKVEAGQLLADSNYTKDGVLAMGTNLKTIYVPYKGLSVSGDTMVLWTDKDSAGHFTPIREIPLSAGIKANALDTNDLVPRLHDIHSFIGHYTDDEMTEVLTVDGIAVKATESHSFITINDDGDLREIAPKDMVPGKTLLPVARPQLPLSDSVRIIELNPFENGGRTVTIPLSWDIGFLFGMYTVGGMAIGSNKGPKGIRIVITDDEVINKVRQTLMSLGVLFKHHTRTGGDGVGGILRSYNTALAKFLAKNCGSVAENKKIPDILWSSNPEFINGFISGYWSGDRTTKSPAMTATISKELAEGICFLLASIGVRATYSTHNKTPYLKQYLVTVLPHSLSKFPDIFLKRKNEALLELKAKPVERSIDRVPVPAKDRKVIEEALGMSAIGNKEYVSRELLLEALAKGADISSRLKLLIHSSVWWDVVESVKKIEFENYVYDLDMRPIANFVVGPGLVVHNTFEDGIVVSESASQKLTSQHMYRFDLPVDDSVSLSKDKWLAYFANKAEPSQIGKLDASGVIKPGTPVTKGDYLIAAMRLGEASPEDAMLGKLSRRLAKPYKDISVQWEKDNDGHVVDVVINPKNITVTVRMDASLVVGDKITNREGGKGVVTSVLPDSEMPKDKDGNAYDVILNPATVMSRMNIGQLLETAASKVSTEDKPYVAPLFPEKDENISKDVKKLLEKKQIKETDIVYDPSGKEVGEIFAGKQYFYKLGKTTDTNYSARAFSGKYDADMAPLRGGEEGAKGIGLLDMYALLSHNARNILRESVTSKAENNPEFFKALQLGKPLPPPKPTFAFEKFVNYLKGAGVNVDRRGDRFKLLPLTDKDVGRLSSGKIEDATMLKAKDMSEEEGGLFDFNKTGGRLGNKWSHIELAEPVLNPIFIEPARRLLRLKEKELLDTQVNLGGKAIQEMLSEINVDQRLKELNSNVDKLNGPAKDDAIKQIKYLRVLKDANMSPAEAYTIQKVPVIPPIFRPVYPVGSGGETRVSDVNNLYKQVILVSKGLSSDVFKNLPEEEKASSRRELFNTVKALQGLDKSVSGKDYKGFVMSIKGNTPKEGLFQSKLLKKQQDIAGRATIGGDPSLGLDEIKMPEDMAWTLYGPFIIRELVKLGMKLMDAKKEVEERTDKAKEMLLLAMNERPVLLNRAPTLHKFNIMAFKPMPYKGKTLLIPPMVMKPFGADTDGDTMTVHVPVTEEARREALNKMLPSQNLFSVLDKSPHYAPSNEAIFGLYIGTKPRSGSPLKTYQTEKEVVRDLDAGKIQPTDVINYGKAKTTAGAVGVNAILPDELKDYSRTLTKKTLSDVLKTIGQKYPTEYTRVAKGLKDLGDKWAFSPEASLSFKDFELPDVRDKMFAGAKTSLLKFPGRKIKDVDVIDVYSKVQDELIPQLMEEGKRRDNKFYEWSASGSRGSPVQFSSIWGAPVLVTDLQNKTIPSPIKRNFIEGLTPGEYFTSLYGTRKGITATKLSVTEPGAMAKEIVASNVDLVVTTLDCGTRNGLEMDVSSRDALDRLLATDVVGSGKLIARRNSIVTSRLMDVLKNNGVSTIKVRSSITCEAPKGVCASCVGIQENGKLPEIGENIGVKHSMSITEPLTQIALSTKHTAGIGTKGSGVSRLKSILEMPQSEYTKEVLARQDGVIDEVKKLPTGGHKVVVTSGSTQEEYVIPPGLNLIKTEGKVVKGEPLSGGLPNIRDYVSIKGIEAGRSRLADTIKGFYRESGKDIDRRIPETIARGTLNFAKIVSPGDFDLVPGNIVEYNQVAPLKTKRIVPLNPVNAVGYKLANPYGGYERGTRVDAGVAKTLARSKVKRVNVYKEPVVVEPVAIGINKIPVVKNDWLGRMGFRYIANTIREGAATGAEANIHSLNPIPALSYGAEFGKGMSVDVY